MVNRTGREGLDRNLHGATWCAKKSWAYITPATSGGGIELEGGKRGKAVGPPQQRVG